MGVIPSMDCIKNVQLYAEDNQEYLEMFHGVQRSRSNSINSVQIHDVNRQDSIDYDDYQSISEDDNNDPMLKILIENIIDNSDSSIADDEDSPKQNNIHKNWI